MSDRKIRLSVSGDLFDPREKAGSVHRGTEEIDPLPHRSAQPVSSDIYTSPRRRLTGDTFPPVETQRSLYSVEERRRRDSSPWTTVQAVLAPIQFLVFLISLCLVIRYLATGEGLALATASVVVKTMTLYAIMVTGSIWEREVFGRYLFARPFFWEDVFSILVLALHTFYLAGLISGALPVHDLMLVALAAYAAYVINATQFLLKLRAARRENTCVSVSPAGCVS